MDTKVSSELFAIQMKFNDVFDGLQYLDESIVRYLGEKGGEYASLRKPLDKHILTIINSLKSIDYLVIKTVKEWEQEDDFVQE